MARHAKVSGSSDLVAATSTSIVAATALSRCSDLYKHYVIGVR
jgi:hypothetical protein